MKEGEALRRKRLGSLMHATATSPYLSMIAREAGVDEALARKILHATAQSLDPRETQSERPPSSKLPEPKPADAIAPVSGVKMVLNTDGASRGNPGPAGAGAFLALPDGTLVGAYKKFLGTATNNVAEYQAVILGLEEAAKAGASELELRADSELVVRQLTGVYKIKDPTLADLARIVKAKEKRFKRVLYRHVRREQNVIADRLSNEAIDERA